MKYTLLFFSLVSTCFATYKPYPLNAPVSKYSEVSAYITNSGACAISSQDGNWIQSVSRPSAGQCDIDITGYFSAAPYCVAKCVTPSQRVHMSGVSTTNVSVLCVAGPAAGTATDSGIYVICFGAR